MKTLASRDTHFPEQKHTYTSSPFAEEPEQLKTVEAVRKQLLEGAKEPTKDDRDSKKALPEAQT